MKNGKYEIVAMRRCFDETRGYRVLDHFTIEGGGDNANR